MRFFPCTMADCFCNYPSQRQSRQLNTMHCSVDRKSDRGFIEGNSKMKFKIRHCLKRVCLMAIVSIAWRKCKWLHYVLQNVKSGNNKAGNTANGRTDAQLSNKGLCRILFEANSNKMPYVWRAQFPDDPVIFAQSDTWLVNAIFHCSDGIFAFHCQDFSIQPTLVYLHYVTACTLTCWHFAEFNTVIFQRILSADQMILREMESNWILPGA